MKKITALLLAAALCLGALAGCSQPAAQKSADPAVNSDQPAAPTDAAKDPVTVTVWQRPAGGGSDHRGL